MESEKMPQPLVNFLSNVVAHKAAASANNPEHKDQWLAVLERAKAGEFVLKLNGLQMTYLLVIYFKGMSDALAEDGQTYNLVFTLLNAAIPVSILSDDEFTEVHNTSSIAALETAHSIIRSIQLIP